MSDTSTPNAAPKGSETGYLILIIVTSIVILSIFSSFGGCGNKPQNDSNTGSTEQVHHE